jgi:hypothetical protein
MYDIVIYNMLHDTDDPVRVSANHLEQREKLGLNSAPKGQSKPRKTLSGPTNAFERVEVCNNLVKNISMLFTVI